MLTKPSITCIIDHMEQNSNPTTEALVMTFLDRLGAQDADGIGALFADDIDWFVPGSSDLPWTGKRAHGADVADYFRTLWAGLETGKSIVAPGKVLISGNDGVIFAHFTHTAAPTGRVFQTPVALQLEVSGGKIVTLHLYEDTLAVSNAFSERGRE
jgi:ketosteroid isomerase-like protein